MNATEDRFKSQVIKSVIQYNPFLQPNNWVYLKEI